MLPLLPIQRELLTTKRRLLYLQMMVGSLASKEQLPVYFGSGQIVVLAVKPQQLREVCGGLGKVTIDEWAEVVHLDRETPGVCECLRVYGFVKKHGLAMVKEYLYPLSPAAIEAMDVLDGEFDQEQRRLAKVKK